MQFTSFGFLIFFACALIIYYLIPAKMQWVFLLFLSILFYLLSGNGLLILYPLCACAVGFVGICLIERAKSPARRRIALISVLILLIGTLFVLKYVNFVINTVNGISSL